MTVLFDLSWEHVGWANQIFCSSAHIYENALSYGLQLQIHFIEQTNAQTESTNNEDQLCVCVCISKLLLKFVCKCPHNVIEVKL